LKIYDISGRAVKKFNFLTSTSWRSEQFNQLTWDGTDDSRQKLPAGIYFCRLETAGAEITKKIVKLR
jgi:flagellar hook assembly protein FlgD